MSAEREAIEISYHFVCAEVNRKEVTVKVLLDPLTLDQVQAHDARPPGWTRLEVCQCAQCALDPDKHAYCPTALSLVDLVEHFNELMSHTEVETIVVTRERTVFRKTRVQKAVSSLMGLLMATSGCPALEKMKPMARFHLPFATREETIFRSAGAYLLGQYFRRLRGEAFDDSLKGLRDIYEQIHGVNMGLCARLRQVSTGDANLNAVVLLDIFAQDLPFSIEENLAEIEHLFAPYLKQEMKEPS